MANKSDESCGVQGLMDTVKFKSPAGTLLLAAYQDELCLCDWQARTNLKAILARLEKAVQCSLVFDDEQSASPFLHSVVEQLEAYFEGKRSQFDLPLKVIGTDFQRSVWQALNSIPFGESKSYSDIADVINKPKSVRAVANAVGANALSIIIPCHRVLGKNGHLTGYAGGLSAKKTLLNIESNK